VRRVLPEDALAGAAVSRRICPACSGAFVKGRRVAFASRTGLRSALVCPRCAAGALVLVLDRSADPAMCINCFKNQAAFCLLCVAATRAQKGSL
jgi:hypothetical protein